MSLFNSKNLTHYAVAFGLIILASYVGNQFKNAFDNREDEYELIRKYLLNDSPLYGYNKPKLWIHSKYEYNSRKWKSFMSRSSTDLNQPYLHLTVKTIINHCGNDFNVCLIDDESFSRLIPGWDVDISRLAEPKKAHYRELGMAELLYIYGGMVVPNSFVCLRNLMPLYLEGIDGDRPFVCEQINRHTNLAAESKTRAFNSDTYFMGSPKRSPEIRLMADYLKKRNQNPHFFNEGEFVGNTSHWCNTEISNRKMNIIDGDRVGIKSVNGRPILLEDLMQEGYLELSSHNNYGVYIPAEEILRRPKYQWFAVMPSDELLKTNLIVVKYLATAIVDSIDVPMHRSNNDESNSKTVISI